MATSIRKSGQLPSKQLEIKRPEMRANLLALLTKVQSSQSAREAFIANPSATIAKAVAKKQMPVGQASDANRLLFALLANDKMRRWLSSFETESSGSKGKDEFARAFVEQIQKIDDPSINAAMFGVALSGDGVFGLGNAAYQCVCRELPNKETCTCTPVAKNQLTFESDGIAPETIRALSEALVARAKDLAKQGVLADLQQQVR